VIASISIGLLLGSLGAATGQTTSDAGGKAFSNGTAKATAIVARVAPGVGALQLAIASGVAVAELTNKVAQAQAEAADLGLIGSVLTVPDCATGVAALGADDLPQPTRVDNRKGDATLIEDTVPVAGATLGGGHKEARATTLPSSSALASVATSFGPVVSVAAGKAEASTRIIDGATREAHASVEASIDIAGIIKLQAMHWEATHRTGAKPVADASFDIGTASLLGVPIPLEALGVLETAVNNVLAVSGITVHFPVVERFTEPADVVRITPLRIVLKDTPLGMATLGPVLNLSREQRSQLFDQISKAYCNAAGALLVGDIGVSIASGTGFLTIDVGGAEATTSPLEQTNPFGAVGTAAPTVAGPSLSSPSAPIVPGRPAQTALVGGSRKQPVASIGPLVERCESTNPFRHTACSKGALLVVGLLGLLATIGMGALDWRHQRRRRTALGVPG
jgi:hypothetical protein